MKRVLIIGGYGNFGRIIARLLAREADIQLVIAGRSQDKALALTKALGAINPPLARRLDIHQNLAEVLAKVAPHVVIHTSGPFQSQDYAVARACIDQGCHYVDLADGCEFVANITSLHEPARARGVLVCAGASSVPALSGAVIDHFLESFPVLERVEYGIATGQRASPGPATTAGVLSYAGKPFMTLMDGRMMEVHGWLDLHRRTFWGLGPRLLANCDVPDLALFPARYPSLRTLRFRAGLELSFMQLGVVAMAWLVRAGLLPTLRPLAPFLARMSRLFDVMGTGNSGFYMTVSGRDDQDRPLQKQFEVIARNRDGLHIPVVPAVLMARKLTRGEVARTGALPCLGFVTLDDYLAVLKDFDIRWRFRD